MAVRLLDKTSYNILRTNPKVTTNIKIVTDQDNVYLESFNANEQLSKKRFKSFKVDPDFSTYDKDLYRFYSEGSFPSNLAYQVKTNFSRTSVLANYGEQYEMFYASGTRSIGSEVYTQDLGMLAPLWLDEQVPDYFVIFRLDDPAAVNNLNATNALDGKDDAQTSEDFTKNVLENCTAIKTFDLTVNSPIGRYIRNYRFQNGFPEAPLTVSWRKDEPILWNGISLKNGGFTSAGEFSYQDLITKDSTILEEEFFYTKGFERNKVVCANLLNLEFLFSDDNAEDYSLNRYFGLYVNSEEEGSFELDGEAFYKAAESLQTPKIKSVTEISDKLNTKLDLQNPDGILLYVDPTSVTTTTGIPTKDRVDSVDSIFYVKDKDHNFHTIKKGSLYKKNTLRLFDKKVDISRFTGYKIPDTFAAAKLLKDEGKSIFEFSIDGDIPIGLTIKFFDGTDFVGQVSADDSKTNGPGTNFENLFNPDGELDDKARAIVKAINQGISRNERFFEASYSGNKVYVKMLFSGDRFNRHKANINFDEYPDADISTIPSLNEDNSFTANFVGGNNFENARLRVEAGDQDRFTPGNYVQSKGGFIEIQDSTAYLEDPILDSDKNIIGYTGDDKYRVITLKEPGAKVSLSGQVALYQDFKPTFGRFSFFPVRDFDFDYYAEEYSDLGELDYEQLHYNEEKPGVLPVQYEGISTNPDIREFYNNGGFSNLYGLLGEPSPDENLDTTIDSEYDRLQENFLKQQAIASRIAPFINKWAYYQDGRNVRNQPYRLSLSLAFGLHDFAPGKREFGQKPVAFSHEWYYLSKFPYYFEDNAIQESWSYFDKVPTDSIEVNPLLNTSYVPGTFQDTTRNYFDEYFIADKFVVDNKIHIIDRQLRYGRFRGGDANNFAETFLRGIKITAKQKASIEEEVNFNANKIAYVRDGSFNDYKFSAMMAVNVADKSKTQIKFIKNEKWKTIVMVVFLSFKDFCLNANDQSIDRTTLYSAENRFVYNEDTCALDYSTSTDHQFNDTTMQGAISFRKSGTGQNPDPSRILIVGQEDINGVPTKFTRDIRVGLDGKFTPIRFTVDGDIYEISEITRVLTDDKLICDKVTKNGNPYFVPTFEPNNIELRNAEYTVVGGGYREYISLLREVSFAEIFRLVNAGSPDIEYETIDINGNPIRKANGERAQTFTIQFRAPDDILKSNYLSVVPDPDKPTIFNLVDVIGFNLSLKQSPNVTPIARHSGKYEPLSRPVIFYQDPYIDIDFEQPTTGSDTGSTGGSVVPDEEYKLAVRSQMRYKNTQFNPDVAFFGQLSRFFYHKVNVEDPSSILELSDNGAFQSLYPLVNEVAINYRDFYIFSSNWEPAYFRKSIDKSSTASIIGTRSMVEKPSFFGSKYLKIPQQITLETFTPSVFDQNAIADTGLVSGTYMYNENEANVEFYLLIQKRLIDALFEPVKTTFRKYIKPEFSFGDEATIDDDVRSYITNNLLKLYKVDDIVLYVKSERTQVPNNYTTAELSNTDKSLANLSPTGNFASKILNNNPFDTRLIYNKRPGFSESFGFSVRIIKK